LGGVIVVVVVVVFAGVVAVWRVCCYDYC